MKHFHAAFGVLLAFGAYGTPARAVTMCHCTDGYTTSHSAVCTQYQCDPVKEAVPHTPVRGENDCPYERVLVCEGSSCSMVCGPEKSENEQKAEW